MKIFLDTADCEEIRTLQPTGMIDGVTTNPSLIAKSGRDIKQTIAEICSLVDGPVSAEVTAVELDGMRKEADILTGLAENVTIKVPLTQDGLILCRELSEKGTMVNVTLCFSAAQALLARAAEGGDQDWAAEHSSQRALRQAPLRVEPTGKPHTVDDRIFCTESRDSADAVSGVNPPP